MSMTLRTYQPSDAAVITSWLKSEGTDSISEIGCHASDNNLYRPRKVSDGSGLSESDANSCGVQSVI